MHDATGTQHWGHPGDLLQPLGDKNIAVVAKRFWRLLEDQHLVGD